MTNGKMQFAILSRLRAGDETRRSSRPPPAHIPAKLLCIFLGYCYPATAPNNTLTAYRAALKSLSMLARKPATSMVSLIKNSCSLD